MYRVFLLIIAYIFLFLPHELMANQPVFSNSNFVKVDGLNIHYRIWQPKTNYTEGNVLMVHGFGGSTFSWELASDSLAQLGYQAVAVDVPPFGLSDRKPRQNHSVTARATLIHNFLQQQFPETQWHLAGHSMGGSIVQAMALMFPESYSSVNFVAATLFGQVRMGEADTPLWLKIPGLTTLAGNLAESWFITPGRIEDMLASAFGEEPSASQVEAYLNPLLIPGTARAILNMQRRRKELADLDMSQLKVPALAIWGEKDTWVPLPSRRHIIDEHQIPVFVIENAGHNPMETHFQEFMGIWVEFLRRGFDGL